MVNLCWCIDRIRLHLGSEPRVPTAVHLQSGAFKCLLGSRRYVQEHQPETVNEPDVDALILTGGTKQSESPELKQADYSAASDFPWNQQGKWDWQGGGGKETSAGNVCDTMRWCAWCVQVGRSCQSSDGPQLAQSVAPTAQPNPMFFLIATLTILLFIHYLWQCKWLITFKMAPWGEQTPEIMGMKSLAFRFQPSSLGLKIPVRE